MTATEFKKQQKRSRAFWDIKKSGERLLWRLSPAADGSFKPFTPNDNDLVALKSVLAFINRQSENNTQNNQLFAKLYIHFLTQGIRYHQTTVFNDEVHAELHRLLDYPLELFYKAFVKDLHDNQLNRITEVTGDEMMNVVKDAQRFVETYTLEFVTSKLDEAINHSINRFS